MSTSEGRLDENRHGGRLFIFLVIVALALGVAFQTIRVGRLQQDLADRETTRLTYDRSNYYTTAELYAVKPDGTEVIEDETGKLWEINGLRINRFDRLLLEVRNDVVTHVWSEEWARDTGSLDG